MAESSSHKFLFPSIKKVIGDKYSLDFIAAKFSSYEDNSSSKNNIRVRNSGLKGLYFFIELILIGSKYDYIYLSTAPEGNHYTDYFRVLTYYIFCYLYRNRVILTIRNIDRYSRSDVLSKIRLYSLIYIDRVMFESEFILRNFESRISYSHIKYGVIRVRYSDEYDFNNLDKLKSSKKITIGLLGIVDQNKRDYQGVLAVISKLTKFQQSKLKIIFLGSINPTVNKNLLLEFSNVALVDFSPGYMSNDDFILKGLECDFLLAPLSNKINYGQEKGTGAFGDAALLRKPLLIPRFSDPTGEYSDYAIFYQDLVDLFQLFELIINSGNNFNTNFNRFTSEYVYKNLSNIFDF